MSKVQRSVDIVGICGISHEIIIKYCKYQAWLCKQKANMYALICEKYNDRSRAWTHEKLYFEALADYFDATCEILRSLKSDHLEDTKDAFIKSSEVCRDATLMRETGTLAKWLIEAQIRNECTNYWTARDAVHAYDEECTNARKDLRYHSDVLKDHRKYSEMCEANRAFEEASTHVGLTSDTALNMVRNYILHL